MFDLPDFAWLFSDMERDIRINTYFMLNIFFIESGLYDFRQVIEAVGFSESLGRNANSLSVVSVSVQSALIFPL